jgi:RNA polymerase sigma-70 factor (ECF subfamily)
MSFAEVYERYVRFVWRVLRGLGVPSSGVEDAVQDVFLVVHRRLGEFDGRHAIKSWLFAIALRVARDHRRTLRRKGGHDMLDDSVRDRGPSPAESVERREALVLLDRLLDEIDEDKRVVLVMSEIGEMSAPEIAESLSLNLNTVYTRLRRAREDFNKALAIHRGAAR